jgi:hypothetical protein
MDSMAILLGLRDIEYRYSLQTLPYKEASLRSRELRRFGEGRQAALFCYGISQLIGLPVFFAQVERQDYDIIARIVKDGEPYYVPVQLKEWVPDFMPNAGTLQEEVEKLKKYSSSTDLVVAIHLNRDSRIELASLDLPIEELGELWFFGAAEPTQKKWRLIGNLLSPSCEEHEFFYPIAQQKET